MEGKTTILCVDDEQNVLNALRRLFMDEGYDLITAPSGPEGLRLLENREVEIVISDYRMPGMNGIEFLREVYNRWPLTVRIVLSGYADTASVVDAINEGQIYKFIPKPWNDEELKVTVANAIERYHLYKKNTELAAELSRLNQELKRLLDEKTVFMELEGKMLATTQSIFYSLPVPVLGISVDGTVAQCNEAWANETGDNWSALGKDAETVFPEDILSLIAEVKEHGKGCRSRSMNGVTGCLSGSLLKGPDGSVRGVMLVFIREGYCG